MQSYSIGVDVGSNGAACILDCDSPRAPQYLALRKPHDLRQIYQLANPLIEGAQFLLNIEKVNGSVVMSPTDIFKFGINYGVALHLLFGLKSFISAKGGLCEGVRVLTPAGWQNRVREKPEDVFEFGTKPKLSYSERKEEWYQLAMVHSSVAYPGAPFPHKYAADSYLIAEAGIKCAGLNKDKSATMYFSEDQYYDIN